MAPGRVEDSTGVPFVGQAGTLLRNELRRVGLDPQTAYYMNAVSCMPPGNKVEQSHLDACRRNLRDQLDYAYDAKWILSCGQIATQSLIPHATGKAREHRIPIHGRIVWPVYHPSYVLRERWQYKHWRESLSLFKLLIETDGDAAYDLLMDKSCLYCNAESAAKGIPVCSKCMMKWRKDRTWHYEKPVQMEMELEAEP